MMSLAAIQARSRRAAEEAAQADLTPYRYFNSAEVDAIRGFPFPFLGDYVPEGWEEVERWFVDSSGLGSEGEPALTQERFKAILRQRAVLHPEQGYGVVQAGQFQCYVAAYRRTDDDEAVAS